MSATEHDVRDQELMRQVAEGSTEALGVLHRRFARRVFGLAAHTLDSGAAEDLVQEVFLAVWRNARLFDPARGTVRAWILQIAHFRLLNELRRRRRQPADPDDVLERLPADGTDPAAAVWEQRRRAVLRAALDELPPAQRDAVGLAFMDDLTHAEVAAELGLPLGTAKTRIRTGLRTLRGRLAPWAAIGALVVCVAVGVRQATERATLARYDRALTMVTSSDAVNLRLAPVGPTSADTHARYRSRPDAGIAVVTLSKFPPAPAGKTYQAWMLAQGRWTSLGTAEPAADGSARLIAEDPALGASPERVQVTLEPRGGSAAPTGPVVVAWTP